MQAHLAPTLPFPYSKLHSQTETMKRNSLVFVAFFLFAFLLVSLRSARLLAPKQAEKEEKAKGINQAGSLTETKEDFSSLIGLERCDEKDEECLKRRIIAEAHLDYIYTQHRKP